MEVPKNTFITLEGEEEDGTLQSLREDLESPNELGQRIFVVDFAFNGEGELTRRG